MFTAKNKCKTLTINAGIKSDGKRLDGTYNVKLRFTLDRKMRRQGTSLFATPLDLTKDLRIKQSSPLKREVDSLIRNYQERCAKLITDSQINNVCRDYYNNPNFGAKNSTISMFDFHNLLTEANKSSYINDYVQRGINATDVTVGICKALQGDSEYSWFLG